METSESLNSETSSEISSLNNLSEYLISKKFEIVSQYSLNGYCSFLKVICEESGDTFIISIDKKYNIGAFDGVELVPFTDTDKIIVKLDKTNSYGEINSDGIEEDTYLDPTEVDKLMDQYSSIDIDSEKTEILRDNISGYKNQLERLKFCTNNIKYKLSVISDSSLCFINRSNVVQCFAIKKSIPIPNEDRNMCLVIDLETFIDKTDYITTDIKRVMKNLHSILEKANNKHTLGISLRMKQLQNIKSSLVEKYKKREKYQKSIEKLTVLLVKIKKQEKELSAKLKKLSVSTNETSTTSEVERKAFGIKKAEEEYNKLMKFKRESIDLLSDIKCEYNDFVLDFDYSLFDSLRYFNEITKNFSRIGVMKESK